jgi:hypothetical protein
MSHARGRIFAVAAATPDESFAARSRFLTRTSRKNFFTAEDAEENEEKNKQFHGFGLSLRPLRLNFLPVLRSF